MSFYPALPRILLQILRTRPHGLSEYQLIHLLREQSHPLFANACLLDPLSLFRTHFILFHALYRLSDRLACCGRVLDINPLCIRLQTKSPVTAALVQADPLRAYYLDWKHFENSHAEQVQQLLDGSLMRLRQTSELEQALICLGFSGQAPWPIRQQIKIAYRKLASQHHPDRGGCARRLQEINQAMEQVKNAGLA